MDFRRLVLALCAVVIFAAPLTAAFAAQPCAAVATQGSPCDCEDSSASTCTLGCGIASSGVALSDSAVDQIQVSADRVVAGPATAFISSAGPPGLQPPR
jgi:hypothetical protein